MRQTPAGSGRWGDLEFVVDRPTDRCDAWIVCEGLNQTETAICDRRRIVLVTWEPPTRGAYPRRFLEQFGAVVTCHRDLKHPHVTYTQQGLPWFVDRTYDELTASNDVEKTKLISLVTSNKRYFKGHEQRLRFAGELKRAFGESLDLYGRGINEVDNKWDALAPYRYSVAIENFQGNDYITEKLSDCFLAGCFPFYFGAPNAAAYLPADSFAYVDIRNPDEAIAMIQETVADGSHYERHKKSVAEAKTLCLNEHNFFPMIASFIADRLPQPRKEDIGRIEIRPEAALASRLRPIARRARRLVAGPR